MVFLKSLSFHSLIRDLPAVAARVRIDSAPAGDHGIEDILRRVMLSTFVREKSWRDRHTSLPGILPHPSAVTIPFRAIAPAYTIAINPGSIPLPSLRRAKIPINQGFLAKITPNNRPLLPPMQRAARAFFVADPASGRLKQARDQNSPIYGGQNPGAL